VFSIALVLTNCASSSPPAPAAVSETELTSVDGSSSHGLVRLTRSPTGVDYSVNVIGLPVGHYFAELRPDCDSAGELPSAHRLLLLVGADGVGSSRALIGKADELANESALVAVLRPRDDPTPVACGSLADGFP